MTGADLIYHAWANIWNNKQTWTGSIMAALTVLQASEKLPSLMSESAYEWTMLVMAVVMVLFARSTSGGIVSHVIPGSIPKDMPPREGT
jgi:hypothetical protein